MKNIPLTACTPEPLMSYLKALGIFRLLAQDFTHGDPSVKASWLNGCFHLHTKLDQQQIEDFFYTHYQPTPIIGPWAGGSGFFKKDNKTAVNAIADSTCTRLDNFRKVIGKTRSILEEEKVGEKPADETKANLLKRYRTELPDSFVDWMDCAILLQEEGQRFAPLLGTGGNDGRLDFTQNYMQRIVALGLHGAMDASAKNLLHNALHGSPTALNKASVGQFYPGRVGAPNSTQGFEGDSTDNPWDFIFMLEGSLLFAGAASKRLGSLSSSSASFPFSIQSSPVGSSLSSQSENASARGEIWMPIWTRTCSLPEISQLLAEGRAELSGRAAKNALEFGRAVASLGVDRGIQSFARFGFFKRSGKAFLAPYIETIAVKEKQTVKLVEQADPWLAAFRRCCSKDAPARFSSSLRRIESAIFDYCRYGESASRFQLILRAFGNAERELALTSGSCGQGGNCRPLSGLSAEWIPACNDDSPEFDIALALASIYQVSDKIGSLRSNLEPLAPKKKYPAFLESSKAAVWKGSNLCDNLSAILARRLMDADRYGATQSPLAGLRTASLASISAFLDGNTDDGKITELLWGLIALRSFDAPKPQVSISIREPDPAVPAPYALLKLLYLARPLEIGGEKITPYAEPAILPLLRSGNLNSACSIAARRLRSCGLKPIPHSRLHATTRSANWQDARIPDIARLSASLLIPISSRSTDTLLTTVFRKLEPAPR